MKRVIVDTSVAVKWVVPEIGQSEDGTELALALLDRTLAAPDCIAGEFANALFKKIQRQEIGEVQARRAVAILPDIVDFISSPPLMVAAFELSLRLVHPVHDCLFLVLAMQADGLLVTADAKFVARCRQAMGDPPLCLLHERSWFAEGEL